MDNARQKTPLVGREYLWPFILITSLFFLWGLASNMTDTLLAAFKRIMSMSDFQTSWIQAAFYSSYFFLALPAAIFIKKVTYKAGILLGLGLYVLGAVLFYPASITMSYAHFLIALFILAGGLAILETSANPYIVVLGPERSGTQRLNLAQSFNPIGAMSGVLLSKYFILSRLNKAGAEERALMSEEQLRVIQSEELTSVMAPYVGVAFFLVLLWILIKVTKMPKTSDEGLKSGLGQTIKRLIKTPHYSWAVVAQFFYVGAQVGVWSYTINYVMQELRVNEADASDFYITSLIVFGVFRFVFTALMKFFTPRTLLLLTACGAAGCTLLVIFGSGFLGVYSLIAISGCMSLMFPTIYGLGIKGLGDDTKIGGSGLIMAILGGALLTAVQGQVSDLTGNIHIAFFVPFFCFVFIIFYALIEKNLRKGTGLHHEGTGKAVKS